MKITRLSIPKLHQFEDFTLDLTYPKGHKKAGKGLDKICIIGQSGTGKTTLLKLLLAESYAVSKWKSIDEMVRIDKVKIDFEFSDIQAQKRISEKKDDEIKKEKYTWLSQLRNGLKIPFASAYQEYQKYLKSVSPQVIYFPSDLNYVLEASQLSQPLGKKKIIDFNIENAADAWNLVLTDIQKYQEAEIRIRQEISKIAETSKKIEEIQNAVKRLEEWRATNFNPIESVANNCLNPLINRFGLKVKTNLEFNSKEDIGFIKIEDFEGNEIPNGLLSTGTKQVLLSALPIYLLEPKNSILLFDEPERSLYPDIQRIIVEYYLKMTNNCQSFFATHSPIIAGSFEPWEIVELKFDSTSRRVKRELYYKGENHISNYVLDPRYLNVDLILQKIFDLNDTNIDMRTEAIVQASMYKNQLSALKAAGKIQTREAKSIYKKYIELAKKLAWKIDGDA